MSVSDYAPIQHIWFKLKAKTFKLIKNKLVLAAAEDQRKPWKDLHESLKLRRTPGNSASKEERNK